MISTLTHTYANCNGRDCGMGKHVNAGNYICPHNNLKVKCPDLMLEWDIEKNVILPENLTVGSNKKVWWICPINPCGCHKYDATVLNRTRKNKPSGCPFCCNQKICTHNSLFSTNWTMLLQWDYERNLNVQPWEIAPISKQKVWWTCVVSTCDCHRWYESPWERYSNSNIEGCPFCSRHRICLHNSLYTIHPEIAISWDYERNGDVKPWHVAPCSGFKFWWICSKFKTHKWRTCVSVRATGNGVGSDCPHCSNSRGYSKAQIKWVKQIENIANIKIQHALSDIGEFYIPNIGKVDGYCEATNTVYEYHGDFWHGNPDIYHPNDVNKMSHKTFGELYQKTLDRDNKIRLMGYNLIIKWESTREEELITLTINF